MLDDQVRLWIRPSGLTAIEFEKMHRDFYAFRYYTGPNIHRFLHLSSNCQVEYGETMTCFENVVPLTAVAIFALPTESIRERTLTVCVVFPLEIGTNP